MNITMFRERRSITQNLEKRHIEFYKLFSVGEGSVIDADAAEDEGDDGDERERERSSVKWTSMLGHALSQRECVGRVIKCTQQLCDEGNK